MGPPIGSYRRRSGATFTAARQKLSDQGFLIDASHYAGRGHFQDSDEFIVPITIMVGRFLDIL